MSEPEESILSLEDLFKGVRMTIENVQMILNNPKYLNYIRVVVIGTTGAGKSTLIHYFAHEKLIARKMHGQFELVCPESKIPEIVIGAGADSVTVVPGVYVDDVNKLIFIDCPGLLDSEGVHQRILNAYAIHTVLKIGGQIKLLLVMSGPSFFSEKGDAARNDLSCIDEMITNKNDLKKGLVIFITKTKPSETAKDFFEFLKSGEMEKPIWLIDYFLTEGGNDIVLVPAADKEGIYDKFNEYDRSIRLFKQNTLDSPDSKIVVDEDSKAQLGIFIKNMKNEADLALEKFKTKIPAFYENEKDLGKLELIDQNIKLLLDASKKGIYQFAKQVCLVFPKESIEIKENIELIEPWKNFLYNILDQETIKNYLEIDMSSMTKNLADHLSHIEKIEQELREKINKVNKCNSQMKSLDSKCNNEKSDLNDKLKKHEIDEQTYQNRLKDLTAQYTQEVDRLKEENARAEKNYDENIKKIQGEMEEMNRKSRESIQASINQINLKICEVQRENTELHLKLQRQQEEMNRQRNRSSCLLI